MNNWDGLVLDSLRAAMANPRPSKLSNADFSKNLALQPIWVGHGCRRVCLIVLLQRFGILFFSFLRRINRFLIQILFAVKSFNCQLQLGDLQNLNFAYSSVVCSRKDQLYQAFITKINITSKNDFTDPSMKLNYVLYNQKNIENYTNCSASKRRI